ncbi:hypothetical protein [Streptomyces sp. Wb2n-11]|uniref:hypothetical protein n=1 Tax=Streptomyces sp. Wb2n-11 TaxID=1030533 RepID=UPI00159EBA8A|nr:hypothetical protein [Streptomyces sp. Wb2n-11]
MAVVKGDAGGWSVERGALTKVIRSRWAEVEIVSSAHSAVRSLIWELDTANGPGEAYLHEDGTCLYMDVWEEDAIWLAIAGCVKGNVLGSRPGQGGAAKSEQGSRAPGRTWTRGWRRAHRCGVEHQVRPTGRV